MIKRIRRIIFFSGLAFLTCVSFVYGNVIMFSLITEKGEEVPGIMVAILYSMYAWLFLLGITFAIEATQIAFKVMDEWVPSEQLKSKVRKKCAWFYSNQNKGGEK